MQVDKPYAMSKDDDLTLHQEKNALAWPSYAESAELKKLRFPPTAVVVNEFDPLRDDGLAFYRKCLAADINGCSCSILCGTIHGVGSYLVNLLPDVSRDQAR